MSVIEVLQRMEKRLAEPGSWTKHGWARANNGDRRRWNDTDACSWCAFGALCLETIGGDEPNMDLHCEVYRAIQAAIGGRSVVDFNDAPETTHADVLAAIRGAIARQLA